MFYGYENQKRLYILRVCTYQYEVMLSSMNNYIWLKMTGNLNCYILHNVYTKSVIFKVKRGYMNRGKRGKYFE